MSMEYKGYKADIHFSDEDGVFYGKLIEISDLVSFEGRDVLSVEKAFKDAVNDYIQKDSDPKIVYKMPQKITYARLSDAIDSMELALDDVHHKFGRVKRIVNTSLKRHIQGG